MKGIHLQVFYKSLIIAAVMGVMLPASAFANLALNKVTIEFSDKDRPVENINVINQSDKASKVSVAVIEVKNSGLESEQELPTDKVIVAPKTFELAANETRTVRIILRNHPDDLEGIYRVRFIPSEPSFTKEQEVAEGTTVRVGVIMSMGVLILVPPKNPKPDLQFKRTADKIIFENKGNVTAHLQREDFCLDEKTCIQLSGKRVYPGMTWEMPIPKELSGKAFTQTVMISGNYSKLSYPAQ